MTTKIKMLVEMLKRTKANSFPCGVAFGCRKAKHFCLGCPFDTDEDMQKLIADLEQKGSE